MHAYKTSTRRAYQRGTESDINEIFDLKNCPVTTIALLSNNRHANNNTYVKFAQASCEVKVEYELVVGGKTGSGKSTFVNSLLPKEVFQVDDVESCTKCAQTIFVQKGAKSIGSLITDLPGIGENSAFNSYEEMYLSWAGWANRFLYLIKADDKAYKSDLEFFRLLSKSILSKTVIGLSQADKIEPWFEWNSQLCIPSASQMRNLDLKKRHVSATFGIPLDSVVPFSAKQGFNVMRLMKYLGADCSLDYGEDSKSAKPYEAHDSGYIAAIRNGMKNDVCIYPKRYCLSREVFSCMRCYARAYKLPLEVVRKKCQS